MDPAPPPLGSSPRQLLDVTTAYLPSVSRSGAVLGTKCVRAVYGDFNDVENFHWLVLSGGAVTPMTSHTATL